MLVEASTVISKNIDKILTKAHPTSVMAVVKYASEDDIKHLLDDGRIKIIGENRVQDAIKRWGENGKFKEYRDKIELHFIGHLQRNKVKYAVKIFDYIDSIDSLELADEINKRATRKIPVLIQLKINDRETQHGIKISEVDDFIKKISEFKNLSPSGIMAIGPITENKEEIAKVFQKAREVYVRYFNSERNADGFKNYLSLGMSSDWEIALKEGSNLIRIGRALFSNIDQGG